ncbi:MAG: hypothetical protein ACRDRH_30000, partial [Pseudonocardia sp.]
GRPSGLLRGRWTPAPIRRPAYGRPPQVKPGFWVSLLYDRLSPSNPRPFSWTATTDEILTKVKIVEANVRKLVDNNSK